MWWYIQWPLDLEGLRVLICQIPWHKYCSLFTGRSKQPRKRRCTNITDLSNRFSRHLLVWQESWPSKSSTIYTASFIQEFCPASTVIGKVSLWRLYCGGASTTLSNIRVHKELRGNRVLNWEQLSNWTGTRYLRSRHDIYGELKVQLHSILFSSPDGFNFKHWALY